MAKSKLKKEIKLLKDKLEKLGFVIHFQKEPTYSEPIKVNDEEVMVPFTNSAHLWYILKRNDGKLCYLDRCSENELEKELKIWLEVFEE